MTAVLKTLPNIEPDMKRNHEAVRRIQFCAGHRVHLHESKCAHPHGHNYVAFIHARVLRQKGIGELDEIGRVIDFSVLKQIVGTWIDENWDHGFIYYKDDPAMRDYFEAAEFKSYALPYNPTAENMARYLVRDVCPRLMEKTDVEVFKVELWETENCYAVFNK
jgi:6-pyruvoyltetrahydropterin/6-carboxytetrahydropterin synthase